MVLRSMFLILSMLVSTGAISGSGSGKVISIYAHRSSNDQGVIMFKTEYASDMASCSTIHNEWAFPADTDEGKAMYALLLSAATSGLNVTVDGSGECDAWGDRESLKWIRLDY